MLYSAPLRTDNAMRAMTAGNGATGAYPHPFIPGIHA